MIRRATEADVLVLQKLEHMLDKTIADNAPDWFQPLERQPSYFVHLLSDPDVGMFVAEVEGSIVGMCRFRMGHAFTDPRMVPTNRAIGEVLVVLPEHRRGDIGRQLGRAALDWAKGRGAKSVVFDIWDNESARRFYEATFTCRTACSVMEIEV